MVIRAGKGSYRFIFWVPVIFWASLIFIFSSLPTHPVSGLYWKDFFVKKSAHLTEYAIFTILTVRAFYKSGYAKSSAFKYAFIMAVVYGITDEIHQSFTPGREPTVRDVFFDSLGSSLGLILLYRLSLTKGFLFKVASNL